MRFVYYSAVAYIYIVHDFSHCVIHVPGVLRLQDGTGSCRDTVTVSE